MNLTLTTYNGSTISGYSAKIIEDTIVSEADPISVERVNEVPAYGGKSFKPSKFKVGFTLATATRQTDMENIGKLFNPRESDLKVLRGNDTNDSDTPYYLNCTPIDIPKLTGNYMEVTMWAADPVWKTVSTTSGTVTVSGPGTASGTITNSGNVDTYPTITLTPTTTAGTYKFRQHIIAYNPTNYNLWNYPIDVTNGGIDTATLYTGGSIQADGDDIGVLVGNVPKERWLGGTVTSDATLKVWSVFHFSPRAEGTLAVALGSSGNTTITYKNTAANISALERMPATGIVLIDSECIAYSEKNIAKRQLTIEDENSRGVKDTTAATHAVGATIRWIEHNIILEYTNSAAESPDQTDLRKPCFSLENSTNTNWRYDSADSVFGSEDGLRSGAWKPSKPKGNYSHWYGGNQGTVGTDPYTNMGAEIVPYQVGSLYKAESAQIWWTFQNNAGITSISSLGEKYTAATATWPIARLRSSLNGATWVNEWTESVPGTAATWTAWTHASEAVPTGTRFLRFEFQGAVNASATAQANNEVNLGTSGSMGISFESTGVPQITVKARTSNADINTTITNSTTGDSFTYAYPAKQNSTISIDTENRRVKYRGHLLAPPELSSVRQEWLKLQPGSNVITYADSSAGAVTVVFTWRKRKNV